MDGEEVKMDEAFSCGEDYPPLHCQCRCAISPVTKYDRPEWVAEEGEEEGEE